MPDMNRQVRRLALLVLLLVLWVPSAAAWTWPVNGPVLQGFSFDPAHPYAGGAHRGIDIGGDPGTPVLAPAAGVVSFAGTVPTSGKSVTIDTADGLSVTLTHLGSIAVAKNAAVAEGAVVGTVGPSGTPELAVPYVHLGIRSAADPQGYLDPLLFLPVAAPASVPAPAAAPAPPAAPAAAPPAAVAPPAEPAAPPVSEDPPAAVAPPSGEAPPVAEPAPSDAPAAADDAAPVDAAPRPRCACRRCACRRCACRRCARRRCTGRSSGSARCRHAGRRCAGRRPAVDRGRAGRCSGNGAPGRSVPSGSGRARAGCGTRSRSARRRNACDRVAGTRSVAGTGGAAVPRAGRGENAPPRAPAADPRIPHAGHRRRATCRQKPSQTDRVAGRVAASDRPVRRAGPPSRRSVRAARSDPRVRRCARRGRSSGSGADAGSYDP